MERHVNGISYQMEELIPVVAELAEKYTARESTSVSYEAARALMDAVIYCIREQQELWQKKCGDAEGVVAVDKVPDAKEACRRGYERVIQKVKQAQQEYNAMIVDFCAYGNENYEDTVTKAIPGFFRHYDARFAPWDTIITMDYPTLCPIGARSGIDAVEQYLAYICLEQQFLGALPQAYVEAALFAYQADYRKQFYNICGIVLRNVLLCMMTAKAMGEAVSPAHHRRLQELITQYEKEALAELMGKLLQNLVQERYGGDEGLLHYLCMYLKDFSAELSFCSLDAIMDRW